MKRPVIIFLMLLPASVLLSQQSDPVSLSFKMEELTSPQFAKAIEQAGGVCIIPIGIIEKHGPHLPLGTDLFEARETATEAAKKEYAIVFPPYYAGQIFEARHQPGTIAYSNELMWKMLEETCSELSRNGLKKIVLLNGHGGSTNFLHFFCQSQLASQKDYIVVMFEGGTNPAYEKEIQSMIKAKLDGHAGEEETAMMSYIRPDLVDVKAITSQSGADQNRLNIPFGYTGIWWYAKYPNHYASDFAQPNKRLGELLVRSEADQVAELVKYLKTNNTIEKLQQEFNERAQNPLKKVETLK
jgi:creatinine amidohydrolase